MKTIKKSIELINKFFTSEEMISSAPKSIEDCLIAETNLGISFPKSYLDFLMNQGFGGVSTLIVSGIRGNNPEEIKTTGIVWKVKQYREKFSLPHHIIPISDIGDGSSYALDLSQMNSENECPVVIWPVGGYAENPVLEIVAPDFGTWFLEMVEEQIRIKQDS